jgi:hypothetical protein
MKSLLFCFVLLSFSISVALFSISAQTKTSQSIYPQVVHKVLFPAKETVSDSSFAYPQPASYWTGSCDSTIKTDGDVISIYPQEVGWMVFDVSGIPNTSTIFGITFIGYLSNCTFPPWSITPMGNVNPVTDSASLIYNQVMDNYGQNVAYVYIDEWSSFQLGWRTYSLGNNAASDLQNTLSQGWFAMGFTSWDFLSGGYIAFNGWSSGAVPYLAIDYSVPVELTSFTAKNSSNGVILKWQTATETNNQGFEIEKQDNSKLSTVESWEKIGYVPGYGTTTEPKSYSYSDDKVTSGIYRYHLKQIDYNGTYEYSNEVEVTVDFMPEEFALYQNYPNPFNPSTTIKFALPDKTNLVISVYNLFGEKVAEVFIGELEEGYHKVEFNAVNIPSGVYFYRFESEEFNSVKKMVILK